MLGVIWHVSFVFFLVSFSFGTAGRLCYVIMTFYSYLHTFFYKKPAFGVSLRTSIQSLKIVGYTVKEN